MMASDGERDVDAATASDEAATHVVDERTSAIGRVPTHRAVRHSSTAESAARGRAARSELPRSAHGDWEPPHSRVDPVDLLEEQAQARLPELRPIRYGPHAGIAVRVLSRGCLSDGGRPCERPADRPTRPALW